MQKFYTPITFCWDQICQPTLVPWITEFEELTSRDQDIAILLQPSGEFRQGMYVRVNGFWTLVLNYNDLCTLAAQASSYKIIVNLAAPQVFPTSAKLYRNGYFVATDTAAPGPNVIWLIAVPGTGAGGSGATVTLTDMFGTPIGEFLVV